MIAKRHQVDAGDATVSDLQIYYLQHDPASWVTKSTAILDQADNTVHKSLDDSNSSAKTATTWSTWITTAGTLFAIFIGCFIAFQTAKSIKEPIYHLIEVARRIGETGDLDQTIDTHRDDEVGVLAENFNKMIVHLKDMAAVSAAIAEGQLVGDRAAAFAAGHDGESVCVDDARIAGPGAPGARQRRASGQRFGADGQRFGRIGQGERASRLRD